MADAELNPVNGDPVLSPDRPATAAEILHIDDVWPVVMRFLNGLDTCEERIMARRVLIGRLKHPELDGHPQPIPHVRPSGWTAASAAGPSCARCGSPRYYHDIDGQHDSCDGYIEER